VNILHVVKCILKVCCIQQLQYRNSLYKISLHQPSIQICNIDEFEDCKFVMFEDIVYNATWIFYLVSDFRIEILPKVEIELWSDYIVLCLLFLCLL